MKTRFFILLLMLTVTMVLCACDAKRRAQRRIRRITERCPELVTVQAHPIDTFIPLPPVVDSAVMPLAPLLDGQSGSSGKHVLGSVAQFSASGLSSSRSNIKKSTQRACVFRKISIFAVAP